MSASKLLLAVDVVTRSLLMVVVIRNVDDFFLERFAVVAMYGSRRSSSRVIVGVGPAARRRARNLSSRSELWTEPHDVLADDKVTDTRSLQRNLHPAERCEMTHERGAV
jgi:hypothetical protein